MFYEFEDFEVWARARAEQLAMNIEICGLDRLSPDWIMPDQSGVQIMHRFGLFFRVGGLRVVRYLLGTWGQPMFFQPNGHVGLILAEGSTSADRFLLVQMFAEPGNVGINLDGVNTRVLAGPPIQFSPGKLEQHRRALAGELDDKGQGFKPVPFADVAMDHHNLPDWARSALWQGAVEDGGRFFEKVNRYGVITVKDPDDVDGEIQRTGQPENFAWVSLMVWRQMRDCGLINGHLRAIASLLI
ncbi:NDP-hexose 2,3-dehydratase family protein [Candidatus Uhrbacteria bacterium]|nr:NDP-hexose 2,3-dehydratase family protein [Candidatus Uhrbacteria bacterium]